MIDNNKRKEIICAYVEEMYNACKAVTKKYRALLTEMSTGVVLTDVDKEHFEAAFHPKGMFIVWTGDVFGKMGVVQAETIGQFSPRAIADSVANVLIELMKRHGEPK